MPASEGPGLSEEQNQDSCRHKGSCYIGHATSRSTLPLATHATFGIILVPYRL